MRKIVLVLGENSLLAEINVTPKKVSVVKTQAIGKCEEGFLLNQDKLAERLKDMLLGFSSDAFGKEFYVCFTDFVVYKSWMQPQNSFFDSTDKTAEEKEERILNLCRENMPDGLTELYDSYAVSLISCYEGDVEYSVTNAYLPQVFIDNIVNACQHIGVSLFGISCVADALANLLHPEFQQFIMNICGLYIAINPFGLSVFASDRSENEAHEVLSVLTEHLYPIDPGTMNRELDVYDLENYMDIVCSDINSDEVCCAVGCAVGPVGKKVKKKTKNNIKDKETVSV